MCIRKWLNLLIGMCTFVFIEWSTICNAQIPMSRAYECSIESCDTFSQMAGIGFYGLLITLGGGSGVIPYLVSSVRFTPSLPDLGIQDAMINISTGSLTPY